MKKFKHPNTSILALIVLIVSIYSCDLLEEQLPRIDTLTVSAGADIQAFVGQEVTLDGSQTIDAEEEDISFQWEIIQTPSGGAAPAISNSNQMQASFVPEEEGNYIVRLTASTQFEEGTDELTVSVTPDPDAVQVIDEDINEATTWTKKAENPGEADYRVVNSINITAPLTIEEGVIIELGAEVSISISNDGRLNAIGTSANPIVFTGAEKSKGFWGEIRFVNSNSTQNRMEHVIFEYGGLSGISGSDRYGLVNLVTQYSTSEVAASFANCTFRESAGHGLITSLSKNANINEFSNNQFVNNSEAAIYTNLKVATQIEASTAFTNNGLDGMILAANSLEDEGQLMAADYIVSDDVNVQNKLTIAAGANFEMQEAVNFDVRNNGILIAVGTESDPISFYGAQSTKGFWGGIWFTNSRSVDNHLSHVMISGGGNREIDGVRFNLNVGGQYSNDFSEVRIDNCGFTSSSGFGLMTRRTDSKLPSFANNVFEGNDAGDIRLFDVEHLRYIDGESMLQSDNNFVRVDGGKTETDGSWKKLNGGAYVVFNNSVTYIESKIDIEAGAIFKFNENNRLIVNNANAALTADGTANEPITFTSNRNDDVVFWDGIAFYNSNSVDNIMNYCVIEHAGRNEMSSRHGKANIAVGGLYSNDVSNLNITNSTIRNSGGYGISVRSDSFINSDVLTTNTFEGNTGTDVDTNM